MESGRPGLVLEMNRAESVSQVSKVVWVRVDHWEYLRVLCVRKFMRSEQITMRPERAEFGPEAGRSLGVGGRLNRVPDQGWQEGRKAGRLEGWKAGKPRPRRYFCLVLVGPVRWIGFDPPETL